jgi:adenylate cyclase class 2
MSLEVEQKFRVEDLAETERNLERLGAKFGKPVVQIDLYFAHPARDFAQTDEALRIRRVGRHNFVTYKGAKVDQTTKTRRELELSLPGGKQGAADFGELLKALGFKPVREVRKRRRTADVAWQGREIEAALDEIDGLGQFVELELQAEPSDADAARQAIALLATELGLSHNERRSYLELLPANASAAPPGESRR